MSPVAAQRISLPRLPALAVGRIHHTRHRPKRYAFTHRHYQWLVDLDAAEPSAVGGPLPRWLRPVSRIDPAGHLGGHRSLADLRSEVERRVREHVADSPSIARVVLLAHARVLGHAFDPMSAFWCLDAEERLVAVVIEVHNTYGGRHAYVVVPDERGHAVVDKDFYVSPFNDVEGDYAVRLHLDHDRVAVGIRLHVADQPVMTASVSGRLRPAATRTVVRTLLTHPLMPQRVSGLIRFHGIRLWASRLPLVRRPEQSPRSIR